MRSFTQRHVPVCRTAQLKIAVVRSMAAGGTAGGYPGVTSHARRPLGPAPAATYGSWPARSTIATRSTAVESRMVPARRPLAAETATWRSPMNA